MDKNGLDDEEFQQKKIKQKNKYLEICIIYIYT